MCTCKSPVICNCFIDKDVIDWTKTIRLVQADRNFRAAYVIDHNYTDSGITGKLIKFKCTDSTDALFLYKNDGTLFQKMGYDGIQSMGVENVPPPKVRRSLVIWKTGKDLYSGAAYKKEEEYMINKGLLNGASIAYRQEVEFDA